MLTAESIHRSISAACPIDGVSIGSPMDKATWRIDYSPSATPAQKSAAQGVVAALDVNAAVIVDPVDAWDIISLKIAFNHENRIRTLEGKAPITVAQFKAAVRVLVS